MNIALDVNPLVTGHQYRGIGFYVKNLLASFLNYPEQYKHFLYYNGGVLNIKDKKEAVDRFLPEQKEKLPQLLQQDRVAILHITDFYHPIYSLPILEKIKMQGVKIVISLADVIPLRFPEHYPGEVKLIERNLKPLLPLLDMVLAISNTTAQDLINFYSLPREKVAVSYLGVDQRFFSPVVQPNDRDILELYRITPPYFLYVGGYDWRKNYDMAIKAYTRLLQKSPGCARLVFVGMGPPTKIDQLMGDHYEKPIVTGFIPEEHLPPLYRNATSLIFPSRYEGFGLPILEAMSSGTPVIAANSPSVLEVAGDSAIIRGPDDIEGWEQAMKGLLSNPGLVESMRKNGLSRVKDFTWDHCALQTRKAYNSCFR